MSGTSLYHYAQELAGAFALLDASEGEWTPEIEEALTTAQLAFGVKLDMVLCKRQDMLGDAKKLRDEADRLAQRATALESRADWIARFAEAQMRAAGVPSFEGERFTAKIQVNPPKVVAVLRDPPALRDELDALPEDLHACVKVNPPVAESYAWDKAAILRLAKTNPEAAASIAKIERGERLVIK